MAKDYFEDITPPDEPQPMKRPPSPVQASQPMPPAQEERSIRNITVNRQRSVPPPPRDIPGARKPKGKWLLWTFAVLAILVLAAISLVALRKTTVTITPHSQTVSFDATSKLSAYPSSASSTGMLTYDVATADFEDSEVLPATGKTQTDHQASGSITVVNEYSDAPVKLIKSTRFQTAEGLVFKTPADVSVPARKGSIPGTIQVTVVAEKPGGQYNVGPTTRFSLPGLVSNSDMYAKVYGTSQSAMSGGASTNDPAVDPTALSAAQAQMRSRLEEKAREEAATIQSPSIAFAQLMQISYQDLPATPEPGNALRLHVKAHVSVPVFSESSLSTAIAHWANTDPQGATLSLVPGAGFAADTADASSSTLGLTPIVFMLKGAATVVWQVDGKAVSMALAGKDEDAFQTIVNGFAAIQEAKARVEPFWSKHFPSNPDSIDMVISSPGKSGQ